MSILAFRRNRRLGPNALTERRLGMLRVIADYTATHGYPPAIRELGAMLGLSSYSTVHSHLEVLQKAGYLHREGSQPRALFLTEEGQKVLDGNTPSVCCPTCAGTGRVPA